MELISALSQVQLLVSNDSVDIYKRASENVRSLLLIEETSELWINGPNQNDKKDQVGVDLG